MATNNITPFEATHPVELVKDELKARGMSKKELATRMNIQQANLSRLLRGGTSISVDIARKLEQALGIPADYWISLQLQYDKDCAAIAQREEEERSAITVETSLHNVLNLPYLYSQLSIRASIFVQDKLDMLRRAFHVEPIQIPALIPNGAFKKSEKLTTDEKNLNTWLLLAYVSANNNAPQNPYEKGNADKAAGYISSEMNKGTLTQSKMESILSDLGISYSVVRKIERVPVDAFSFWKNEYPSIVTTNRYNDMSRLVFNVLHELGHISLHLRKGEHSGFISSDGNKNTDLESEANKFAADALIPPHIWKEISRSEMPRGFASIVPHLKKMAKEKSLSEDVVIWRYKHDTGCYNLKGTKALPIR